MDPRLSELRLVEWELVGSVEPRRELVLASEVELLCQAVLRLHHDPGRNPHSEVVPARLRRLCVGLPRLEGGHWWSGPALAEAGPRAHLVQWTFRTEFEAEPELDPLDPA